MKTKHGFGQSQPLMHVMKRASHNAKLRHAVGANRGKTRMSKMRGFDIVIGWQMC